MPDQFWCLECDKEYSSPTPGSCPHCGNALQNLEGVPEDSDIEKGPQEYVDRDFESVAEDEKTPAYDDDMSEGLRKAA